MSPGFTRYLQHNWPLATIASGLAIFMAIVLVTGMFPTNQGRISRSGDPSSYWRWIRRFAVLLAVSMAVLTGSYLLSPA